MTITRLASFALGGVVAALSLPACDLDVPDLNNPGLDVLENAPTAVSIGAACTGLLIGNRSGLAPEIGYVDQLGILGREAYSFDKADNRYIGELLAGKLNKGSPFGGAFWGAPYANIRLANVVRHALAKVGPDLDDGEKSAISGFVSTMEALDLLEVINTHDTNGAVIDTDQPIVLPPAVQPLGAIVDKPAVLTEIARLLDSAVPDLTAGTRFPFAFSEGWKGFDDPASFLKVNRAIRARVAAYMADYDTALTALKASFIVDMPVPPAPPLSLDTLNVGVYYTYTTKAGDATNGLVNQNIFAHPSVTTDAEPGDTRLARKVALAKNDDGTPRTGMGAGLSSTTVFTMYTSPSSSVPLIRNEELVLLRAEALYFSGNKADGITELNLVRSTSGGLGALAPTTDDATFTIELLYERRYSLLFEGGHRWIDVRRFNRTMDLPLDDQKFQRNVRYPFPLAECNARPDEPRCMLGSTDP